MISRIIRRMSSWLFRWSIRSRRPEIRPLRRQMEKARRSHKSVKPIYRRAYEATHSSLGRTAR